MLMRPEPRKVRGPRTAWRGLTAVTGCAALVSLLLGLAACPLATDAPPQPLPTFTVAAKAPSAESPVIIFLPGRGDDLEGLRDSHIADTIQQSMPEARIVLVGATLPFYSDGQIVERLHRQVIEPLRRAGAREIWLAGISLGGFGALLYEHDHPGELSGLVLLSPFMGKDERVAEVEAGTPPWLGESEPEPRDFDSATRAVWRLVLGWRAQPAQAARVWLACGSDDKFLRPAKQIAAALPDNHFLEPEGGHRWRVWTPAARTLFARIEAARRSTDDSPP